MPGEPVPTFTFSFRELAPALEPALALVVRETAGRPPGGVELEAPARPRWLPRLLPVFRAHDPLLVAVCPEAGPAFARRLLAGLAGVFAAAGRDCGVRVLEWDDRIAIGCHALEVVAREPHAVLVAADLDAVSVTAAADALRQAGSRGWLVLDGVAPEVDSALGVQRAAEAGNGRVLRLPMLDRRDLRALREGRRPPLMRRSTGEAYLALARALVMSYLERA